MAERKVAIAPSGTYLSLEQLYDKYEGEIHPALGKIVRLRVGFWEADLRKEAVCPEGGSCMDLVTRRKLGEWGNLRLSLVYQLHIASGDEQGDPVRRMRSYTTQELHFVGFNGFGTDVKSRPVPIPNILNVLRIVGL